MKKNIPYLIGGLLALVVIILLFTGNNNHTSGVSTSVSLKKEDKNPYGTYVLFRSLHELFPNAAIVVNATSFLNNKKLQDNNASHLFVSISPAFAPGDAELKDMITFIERGNNVFISCFYLGESIKEMINAETINNDMSSYPAGNEGPYNLYQELEKPPFMDGPRFSYPGLAMKGFFYKTAAATVTILGRDNAGRADFIQLKKGDGNLFIHLSPLAFSNYFLLYKNNIQYFNQVFSLLPKETPTIIWDQYYRWQRNKEKDNKSWMSANMKEKPFRAGILLGLLLLLLYALTEMKRKQRLIPVIEKAKNDSLDFVKTMGLLYYEKRDNNNLAQKMSAYFLEHVRNKYKIFSKELNDIFIQELSDKSGVDAVLITGIVQQINQVQNEHTITDEALVIFQQNIEEFYKKI